MEWCFGSREMVFVFIGWKLKIGEFHNSPFVFIWHAFPRTNFVPPKSVSVDSEELLKCPESG